MSQVRLQTYDNSWYDPGRSVVWRAAWLLLGLPLLRAFWIPSSTLRVSLLRLFGSRIGKRVVIKPGVTVKYPWHLVVGDDCWIGENSWIDNLTTVQLGNDVCIRSESANASSSSPASPSSIPGIWLWATTAGLARTPGSTTSPRCNSATMSASPRAPTSAPAITTGATRSSAI